MVWGSRCRFHGLRLRVLRHGFRLRDLRVPDLASSLSPRILHRNLQRFRSGIAFRAHRLSISLNSRLANNIGKEERGLRPGELLIPAPQDRLLRLIQGSGFRVQGSGSRVQGSGSRVQGLGFRVQGAEFRVQGSGFRVQGSRIRV